MSQHSYKEHNKQTDMCEKIVIQNGCLRLVWKSFFHSAAEDSAEFLMARYIFDQRAVSNPSRSDGSP